MTGGDAPSSERRHSVPDDSIIVTDVELRAELEAQNGLRQFDAAMGIVEEGLSRDQPFKLRPSAILALHREALRDLTPYAGNWRPSGVKISGSRHSPAGAHLVPELVEEMCDYVNARWDNASAIHLAAYVMWRLNWIHPFTDGNGRTSRIVAYLVLCVGVRNVLKGKNTIPDQIVNNRGPYFKALERADEAYTKDGSVDVREMEELLEGMLALQLKEMIELATHKTY